MREISCCYCLGCKVERETISGCSCMCIRLEKHLQCEKLLGLARGTTKKRGNKKSDESITPIRYNVNHMYTGSFPMFSQPICHAIFTGGVMTNPYIYLLYIRMWGT